MPTGKGSCEDLYSSLSNFGEPENVAFLEDCTTFSPNWYNLAPIWSNNWDICDIFTELKSSTQETLFTYFIYGQSTILGSACKRTPVLLLPVTNKQSCLAISVSTLKLFNLPVTCTEFFLPAKQFTHCIYNCPLGRTFLIVGGLASTYPVLTTFLQLFPSRWTKLLFRFLMLSTSLSVRVKVLGFLVCQTSRMLVLIMA